MVREYWRSYKGYYYGYIYWVNCDKATRKEQPPISPYRILIYVDDMDEKLNVIHAKLTSPWKLKKWENDELDDKWGYKGILVPAGEKLFFMFESSCGTLLEYVFIIIFETKPLIGIFSAESSDKSKAHFGKPKRSFPATSRVVLTEIGDEEVEKGEDSLMKELRFCELDEIDDLDDELKLKLCEGTEEGILIT